MDNNKNIDQEFEILGFKVRFKSHEDQRVKADEVVGLIQREAIEIRKKHNHLDNGQIAILVSLKIASDLLKIESECHSYIDGLKLTAQDALRLVEEISPATPH